METCGVLPKLFCEDCCVCETLDLFQAKRDDFVTSFETVRLWMKSCIKDEVR